MIGPQQLLDFYARYAETLDDDRLVEWPEFFAERCLYRIVPRENWDRDLPIGTVHAESRAMLQDRVDALVNAMVYSPRYYRRFLTNTRIVRHDETGVTVRQNVLVVQTLINKPSEILLCGVAHDVVADDAGVTRFSQRIIVYDSEMILNSLIFPV